MRYLTRRLAVLALQRGSGIEQFLGAVELDGAAGIRWVTVGLWRDRYRVSLHTAHDLDDEGFLDLGEFPPLDPAEDPGVGRELGLRADPAEAIDVAERLTAAVADRWVNFGVAGDEYRDLIRRRARGSLGR